MWETSIKSERSEGNEKDTLGRCDGASEEEDRAGEKSSMQNVRRGDIANRTIIK